MLGYFVPQEDSNYKEWELTSSPILTAYKANRQRLREDAEAHAKLGGLAAFGEWLMSQIGL